VKRYALFAVVSLRHVLFLLAMWVQTHQPMPDRPGGALPQPQPVPFATPPRAAGAGPAAAGAGAATANTGEPSFAPPSGQPPSVPGSEGTFLFVDDPPAAPGIRDSFASIVDDPFFVRYDNTPEPESGPGPPSALPPPTSAGHRNEERQQPWIPPRKESLSETSLTPWVRTPSTLLCPPEGTLPTMEAPVLSRDAPERTRETDHWPSLSMPNTPWSPSTSRSLAPKA
jgi:hypothetical protein